MGKRQTRIFQPDFSARLPGIVNMELSLVLKNGKTIRGKILSFGPSSLVVTDMFSKKHPVELQSIEEIITDNVSEY